MKPEQLELLSVPLPREAVKPHPTKTGMSTISVIYVTERLNQVFGVGAWCLTVGTVPGITPIITTEKTSKAGRSYTEYTAILKTVFTVPSLGIIYESIASSTNEDIGDACKGAKTDALTEIAGKFLGIGSHVWRNDQNPVDPRIAKWSKELAKISTIDELKEYYDEHQGRGKEFSALVVKRKSELS
jgi:hypothetical protein